MPIVLQYLRTVDGRPTISTRAGFRLRNYRGEGDIAIWLGLRAKAFARQRVGVRTWDRADFEREMLGRWWWKPEWMWFVETDGAATDIAVGSVTLALRGVPEAAVPAVHWLTVLPAWRRRGVGRMLMGALEAAAWDAGYRSVCLETHAQWTEAVQLYEALGYRLQPARPPDEPRPSDPFTA
jgi:GNAT superfamily N-acetyltransferase